MSDHPPSRDEAASRGQGAPVDPVSVAAQGGGEAPAPAAAAQASDTVPGSASPAASAAQGATHAGLSSGIQGAPPGHHQGGTQSGLGHDHGGPAPASEDALPAGQPAVEHRERQHADELPARAADQPSLLSDKPESEPNEAALLKAFKHMFLSTEKNSDAAKKSAMTKEQMTPPRKDLDKQHQLRDDDCFASLVAHCEHLHKQLSRKEWSNTVEQWALAQMVPGSNAYHTITNFLTSGMRAQHPTTKNYFASLEDYKTSVLGLFFHDKDALVVIEQARKKTHLSPNGQDSPFIVKTLVAFANKYRTYMSYAPDSEKYSERLQIATTRVNLPAQTQAKLNLYELNNQCMITTYPVFLRCLTAEDQAYSQAHKTQSKQAASTPPAHASKTILKRQRDSAPSFNQVQCDARQGPHKKPADQRPRCPHCKKPGHQQDQCWELHPEKKREFNSRSRNGAAHPTTTLQSMLDKFSAKLDSSLAKNNA